MNDIKAGDIVTRGKSRKLWRVTEIHDMGGGGTLFAWLQPLEGYTSASATLDRLTLVERPS